MTLRFDLAPEAEARLRDRAVASGLSPEEYARRLVEDAVRNGAAPEPGTLSSAEAERRARALEAWFAGHRATGNGVGGVDDSRESIYAGRGE